jgi:hypothetical protein
MKPMFRYSTATIQTMIGAAPARLVCPRSKVDILSHYPLYTFTTAPSARKLFFPIDRARWALPRQNLVVFVGRTWDPY